MPFVANEDALNEAFVDIDALTAENGPPPWRALLVGTGSLRVVLLHWTPGYETEPHLHPHAVEVFQVIRGRALFTIGDEPEQDVGPGEFLLASRGVPHAIRVPGPEPLLFLAAVAPNEDRPDETVEPRVARPGRLLTSLHGGDQA